MADAGDRTSVSGARNSGEAEHRVLRETARVQVGRYECPPTASQWSSENQTGPWPLVVFPRVPVGIRQSGSDGVVADPAAVMFYNERCAYERVLLHGGVGDRCDVFAIEPALARRIAGDSGFGGERGLFPGPRGVSPRDAIARQRRFRAAMDELDDLAIEEETVAICGSAMRALGELYGMGHAARRADDGPLTRAQIDLAEGVRVVLSARYREAVSLSAVADEVGASEFHMCRVFRARCGETIHGYRTRLRMVEAVERLIDGGERIVDIALDLGYSSQAHFTTAFKRAFGGTPSRFRATRGAVAVPPA